jgi:recombination protein RecA
MVKSDTDFVIKSLEKAFKQKDAETSDVEFFDAQELETPLPNHTGSLRLDINLGIPIPCGRIIEIYGNPGSGKTTLALSIAAEVVARGGHVLFIDQERRLAPSLVATFPILVESTELFKVAKVNNGDNALRLAEQWCRQFEDALVIIDSVDSLIPERVEDREIGETDVGSLPKLMSDGCRKLKDACDSSGSTVIFLNQVRSKIGAYGDPDTSALNCGT